MYDFSSRLIVLLLLLIRSNDPSQTFGEFSKNTEQCPVLLVILHDGDLRMTDQRLNKIITVCLCHQSVRSGERMI